jgi:hypothetical protein
MTAMVHHHEYLRIPIAVFFGAMPWWISALNSYGEVVTHFIVPTLSAGVLACQLWIYWKRYMRRK